MLNILLAASADTRMTAMLLPVVDAFVARGHRVVFLADPVHQERIRESGAVFVDAGHPPHDERVVPGRFLPGVQQVDARIRRTLLSPLHHQWSQVRRIVDEHRIDVVLTDPLYFGASALGLLPREGRPAVISLGSVPLGLPDPSVAPYGFGMPPSRDGIRRLRNVVLHAVLLRVLLAGLTRDVKRALHELTGERMRGTLADAAQYPDVWAQLTVAGFEYPRARTVANLRFIGPLRPDGGGSLPSWWDYRDARPMVCVRYERGTALENLVLPAMDGLQHEDVLLVVTGARESDVVEAYGRPLPRNVRVEQSVPYAHLLPSAKVVVKAGDYVHTQYALRWGVPLVVAGVAEEQIETNARIEWSGVGIDLRTARPSATQMRAAVLRVLADPGMRHAASRIAAQIARTDAENTLVDMAERLAAGASLETSDPDPAGTPGDDRVRR